jgi:hypothetical protein
MHCMMALTIRVKEMQRLAFSACLFDKACIASLSHKRGTRLCFPPSLEGDSYARRVPELCVWQRDNEFQLMSSHVPAVQPNI